MISENIDKIIKILPSIFEILPSVLEVANIVVVVLISSVLGREKISLYRGLNELAGYIHLNIEHPDIPIEIVVENRGYAEQSFNFIQNDKGEMLWCGRKTMPPRTVAVFSALNDPLPKIKRAKQIYLLTGMRRKKKEKKYKNEIDKWEHVEIISEKKIQEFLSDNYRKTPGKKGGEDKQFIGGVL